MASTRGLEILNLLSTDSAKSSSDLMTIYELKRAWPLVSKNVSAVSFLEDDFIMVKGVLSRVHKVYVRHIERIDDGVGWVLNECITSCMVCQQDFGAFLWRHHCRYVCALHNRFYFVFTIFFFFPP